MGGQEMALGVSVAVKEEGAGWSVAQTMRNTAGRGPCRQCRWRKAR